MPTLSSAIRELYPFESRWLDIGGVRMHYVDEGAGEPLVMVHGNPTWSFYWRELIKAMRPTNRCVAMDHIGCGLSDKPPDAVYTYRLERRVSDLEALLDHLGLASGVTLVLHDWGGMIGMAAALRRPERISRVVLLNTAAFLLPEGKGLPLRLRLLHKGPLGPLLVQGLSGFARGAVYMASMRGLAPAVRAGYLAPYDSWANRIATLRFVQDIPLEEEHPSWALAKWVDDRVASLAHQPTLICWGERDFVFDRDFLAQWLKRLPGAEVHSFPGAGHYVMEDECEAIIGLVKAFLRVNRT